MREIIPKRRSNPKRVSRYQEYKDDLRADFNNRCGYCDDEDKWTGGKRNFQIDHFVPRKQWKTISEKEYSNLIYSCFFCNNSKRSDWPTNDEYLHNDGREGYIDVCLPEYDDQFYRTPEGEIFPRTDLGRYMSRKLKLFLKRHAIIWKLRKTNDLIEEIENKLEEKKDPDLKEKHYNLLVKWREYSQQLMKCNEE